MPVAGRQGALNPKHVSMGNAAKCLAFAGIPHYKVICKFYKQAKRVN